MLSANTKTSEHDNRGKNPNSLANLSPGNKTGARHRLTKAFVEAIVDYLEDNREEFERRMASLSDRDYVAAYIKMAEIVTPKKLDAVVENIPVVDWTINVVPNPAQQTLINAAQAENKKPRFDVLTDGESWAEDVTPSPLNEA